MSKAGEGSKLPPRALPEFRGCHGWVLQLENSCRGALCQQAAGRFSPLFLQLKGTSVQNMLWIQLSPPPSKSCADLQRNVLVFLFFLFGGCYPKGLGSHSKGTQCPSAMGKGSKLSQPPPAHQSHLCPPGLSERKK